MRILVLLATITFASSQSAQACLNDQSLPNRESEFRSQYQSDFSTHLDPPRKRLFAESPILPAVGVTMIVCAGVIAFFGARTEV